MLEPSRLRAFLAVATELNFGRAAKRLNMTQPPLSRQIRLLEEELGTRLLDRNRHAVHLTAAGRALVGEARAIIEHHETAAQAVRRAAGATGGSVRVGFLNVATYDFIPRLVGRVRLELPDIDMTLLELPTALQMDALSFGRIDLALARPAVLSPGIEARCVAREEMVLALPADHPLTALRRPELSQLNGEPFIIYAPEAAYMRGIVLDAFSKAAVQPRIVQQVNHSQAMLSLVSTGMGVAIVPEEVRNASFSNVVFRPITLGYRIVAELYAIWRSENRNPTLGALLNLIPPMPVPSAHG